MEPDISIWRKTGHFYFALTRRGHAEDTQRTVSGTGTGESRRRLDTHAMCGCLLLQIGCRGNDDCGFQHTANYGRAAATVAVIDL